ncbi:fused MFS/spermidine synthase [Achromobacter seleniivolatilans]|uniref:Fused MFS/spermidine synthase n=1 Tax=Achromobacter seleniivolatilans TaxID=3047478 RepID=A0ABY9M657_9BURK|nr:fused MFS/spermidine synthase [Achromobacter sp. R39]WMD22069.1 fused MFS/spermidine synthase [Achromobacter sp. R39]
MFSHAEIQSRMWTGDPNALNLEYTRIMMAFLLFNPQPRRIAMVGLGGGSLAKFCYQHLPSTKIDVFEINPHVIALRDTFLVPPDDGRFAVLQGDGAQLIQQYQNEYDAVLVDGYDINGLPGQLTTEAFYDHCVEALAPDGMMVCNFHASNFQYGACLARIKKSFSGSVIEVADTSCAHSIVFACNGDVLKRRAGLPKRKPALMSMDMWSRLQPTYWSMLI